MSDTNNDILIFEEEALRDGLQMESRILTLDEKLILFNLLKDAGISRIQVGAFVHPKIVPQMADTDAFIEAIGKQEDMVVSALILNEKGLERALACEVAHMSMSVSVSNAHSMKNAGKPADQALAAMTGLIRQALDYGRDVRAGLQCAFGCVYQGNIPEKEIFTALEKMAATGVREINLADSTGMATPKAIRCMIARFKKEFPTLKVSLHLHDTRGMGMMNLFAGYEAGVRIFDVCAGGLGGCPFIKGAAGNVATEDAVNMFECMGIPTGIDIEKLCKAVSEFEKRSGPTPSGAHEPGTEIQTGLYLIPAAAVQGFHLKILALQGLFHDQP